MRCTLNPTHQGLVWLLLVLLFATGGTLLASSQAQAWSQFRSPETGTLIQWPVGTCDIPFLVDAYDIPSLPSDREIRDIGAAFEAWSAAGCAPLNLRVEGLEIEPRPMDEDRLNKIVFVRENWEHSEYYVALTVISFTPSTGDILDVDILMNLDDFAFSDCTADDDHTIDFRFTILHETGHAFGLDHSEDHPEAALYSSGSPYCGQPLPEALSQDDVNGVCAIYGGDDYAHAICHEHYLADTREEVDSVDSGVDIAAVGDTDSVIADPSAPRPSPSCSAGVSASPAVDRIQLGCLLLMLLVFYSRTRYDALNRMRHGLPDGSARRTAERARVSVRRA